MAKYTLPSILVVFLQDSSESRWVHFHHQHPPSPYNPVRIADGRCISTYMTPGKPNFLDICFNIIVLLPMPFVSSPNTLLPFFVMVIFSGRCMMPMIDFKSCAMLIERHSVPEILNGEIRPCERQFLSKKANRGNCIENSEKIDIYVHTKRIFELTALV